MARTRKLILQSSLAQSFEINDYVNVRKVNVKILFEAKFSHPSDEREKVRRWRLLMVGGMEQAQTTMTGRDRSRKTRTEDTMTKRCPVRCQEKEDYQITLCHKLGQTVSIYPNFACQMKCENSGNKNVLLLMGKEDDSQVVQANSSQQCK